MLHRDMLKSEIEKIIDGKGGFVQIDYLTAYLKEDITMEMKKFAYSKLIVAYERMRMYADVAKVYHNLSVFSIAYSEKMKCHIREADYYIKAGDFENADLAMKKGMHHANSMEKEDIYFAVKNLYLRQAEVYEKEMKRNQATKIYEKLLEMNLTGSESGLFKKKLIGLYEKLGKFHDAKRIVLE